MNGRKSTNKTIISIKCVSEKAVKQQRYAGKGKFNFKC